MSAAGIVFYSALLGAGAALIGFVIGLMIDLTSVTAVSILLVVGLTAVAGAIAFLRWRRRRSRV